MNSEITLPDNVVKDKIHTIRGKQVILDRDLAELYGVEVKYLKRQVRRNIDRFPEEFCFELTYKEMQKIKSLRCQNVTLNKKRGEHSKYLSYVFTEQGVSMLSAILKSDTAIEISIKIIKAFVSMRHFLLENKGIFHKFQQIDQKLIEHDNNFNKIFKAIESKQLTPNQGIFFDGQIFDAYKFITDLVKQAENNIILIDNYIDETTLTLLSNKKQEVQVKIYTKDITKQLLLAKDKFNQQYKNLEIIKHDKSHDRFLIIDNQTYHIGASIKDVGKKWFAFSKLNLNPLNKH